MRSEHIMASEMGDDFLAQVSPEPTSGCWLWTGQTDRDGYARLSGHLAYRPMCRMCHKCLCNLTFWERIEHQRECVRKRRARSKEVKR